MNLYTVNCKNCGAILQSNKKPFVWEWDIDSYQNYFCWFCGYEHLSCEHVEYRGFK